MDPLSQFEVLVPAFQQLAGQTSVDQLDNETPCSAWKVRDLFGHVRGGATTFAAAVRGEDAPEPHDVADADLPGATNQAVANVQAAFQAPGAMEKTLVTPFGEMPGDAFARLLAVDLLAHSWDLAQATGQALSIPDEVVAAADGFARAAISPEIRGPQTFGPEVEPAEGASPIERLVAFTGRTP